jgi:20S proteasome subunit beta 6
VYVYDAIGSYERVAVASAGTGRELLQPILDRLFSGPPTQAPGTRGEGPDEKIKESMAVSAGNQRMGVAGSLRPPVRTTVTCSWEEAVDNVARAYRSVAEREISVGDEIVICVVNTSKIKDGSPVSEVFSYPLKKH